MQFIAPCNYRFLTTDRSTHSFQTELTIVSLSPLRLFFVYISRHTITSPFSLPRVIITVNGMNAPVEYRAT